MSKLEKPHPDQIVARGPVNPLVTETRMPMLETQSDSRIAPTHAGDGNRVSLIGQSREDLAGNLRAAGVPDRQIRMRVAQIWNWLYTRGATDFDMMTNMSKGLRADLASRYTLKRPEMVDEQVSADGTRKWLFRFPPRGAGRPVEIETVYIPEEGRGTLCLSSQVGCTLACTFCHTGTQKLVRNLTAEEIVSQILTARDRLGDHPGAAPKDGAALPTTGRLVSNVVMMGMGEPLYNFDNVKQALLVAADGEGIGLSKRRITLSTSGVVPMIARTGAELGVMLAISLHAVRDDLRDELVPLNRKYPIATLLDACRAYPGLSNPRRITFEYVMLRDVNDSLADARELVRLLKGIPAKINLIPFNPWPGSDYVCSDWDQIERFADVVNRAGYASPIRTPRGRDILAACGQLKSESERLRIRERMALEAMIAG
jgi:23S rRNA (adenine2503-C2)-methyltransferase